MFRRSDQAGHCQEVGGSSRSEARSAHEDPGSACTETPRAAVAVLSTSPLESARQRGSQPAFHAQLAQTDNLRDVDKDRTAKAEEQVKSDHLLNLHLRAGRCNRGESIGSMAGLKAMVTGAGLR